MYQKKKEAYFIVNGNDEKDTHVFYGHSSFECRQFIISKLGTKIPYLFYSASFLYALHKTLSCRDGVPCKYRDGNEIIENRNTLRSVLNQIEELL